MEKNDQLFMQLLYMFHASAMQGLGKIADQSGQLNRNLDYVVNQLRNIFGKRFTTFFTMRK